MTTTGTIADELYEGLRDLSVEVMGRAVPAPELYAILGNLKYASGYFVDELLGRLIAGLRRSLEEYDVREDDGRDAGTSVENAAMLLRSAAIHAAEIAKNLEKAQSAIARQGYVLKDGPA